MTGRAIAETAVALVIALVLTIAACGLLELADGTETATAFFDAAPRTVFGILWPALLLWTVLVLVGNLRNRLQAPGRKFLTGVMFTIAACLVGAIGWLIFGMIAGGWGLLLFAIALFPTVFFFMAAVLALWVTHLGFFRRSPTGA